MGNGILNSLYDFKVEWKKRAVPTCVNPTAKLSYNVMI